mmetsp:Transcript_54699/g.166216  ORF Transcript_54699/g.166216 Transcript_54699/m.166216 type:complete len:359 (-) Transcript_54699:380-1456(-)
MELRHLGNGREVPPQHLHLAARKEIRPHWVVVRILERLQLPGDRVGQLELPADPRVPQGVGERPLPARLVPVRVLVLGQRETDAVFVEQPIRPPGVELVEDQRHPHADAPKHSQLAAQIALCLTEAAHVAAQVANPDRREQIRLGDDVAVVDQHHRERQALPAVGGVRHGGRVVLPSLDEARDRARQLQALPDLKSGQVGELVLERLLELLNLDGDMRGRLLGILSNLLPLGPEGLPMQPLLCPGLREGIFLRSGIILKGAPAVVAEGPEKLLRRQGLDADRGARVPQLPQGGPEFLERDVLGGHGPGEVHHLGQEVRAELVLPERVRALPHEQRHQHRRPPAAHGLHGERRDTHLLG